MDGGLAAHVRQRADRVPPHLGPQPARQRREHGMPFPGNLGPSGKAVQGVGLNVAFGPGPLGVAQPLGVLLPPAEAQPQKQLAV